MHGHASAIASSGGLAAATVWAAFVGGLLGGVMHCTTMCGPLIAATSLAQGATRPDAADPTGRGGGALWEARWFQARFHAGRLVTYTAIGALLGLLAEAGAVTRLDAALGSEQVAVAVRLVATALLIVTGVVMLVAWFARRSPRLPEPTAALARTRAFRSASAWLARRRGWWALPFGMLMGLLPCAPLLPFELAAIASGHPGTGAVVLFAFGVGTLPALVGVGLIAELGGERLQRAATPLAATAVLVLGAISLATLAPALSALG